MSERPKLHEKGTPEAIAAGEYEVPPSEISDFDVESFTLKDVHCNRCGMIHASIEFKRVETSRLVRTANGVFATLTHEGTCPVREQAIHFGRKPRESDF